MIQFTIVVVENNIIYQPARSAIFLIVVVENNIIYQPARSAIFLIVSFKYSYSVKKERDIY